jgi:prepilin-type N-terminal cleavage/methylation domain-containing protein
MKNEKGVTLIELLAAILLFTIILALGFQLFSSVRLLWSNNVNQYHFKNEVNVITRSINKELSDPVSLYGVNGKELRFKTFDGYYKSLVYKPEKKALWIYENNTTSNLENFTYDKGYEISNEVTNFSIKNNANIPLNTTLVINDKRLVLSITISRNQVNKNNQSKLVEEIIEFPVQTMN